LVSVVLQTVRLQRKRCSSRVTARVVFWLENIARMTWVIEKKEKSIFVTADRATSLALAIDTGRGRG